MAVKTKDERISANKALIAKAGKTKDEVSAEQTAKLQSETPNVVEQTLDARFIEEKKREKEIEEQIRIANEITLRRRIEDAEIRKKQIDEEEIEAKIELNEREELRKKAEDGISAKRFKKRNIFKINTGRVIIESFDEKFTNINTDNPYNFLILELEMLKIPQVVEAVKTSSVDTIILIYSDSINSHKKYFDKVKEELFVGFIAMEREYALKIKNNQDTTKIKGDIDHVKNCRDNLFSRMFLMSVQKNAGFDFPMINGLVLFFSSIIHGIQKASDFECRLGDPDIGKDIPMKRMIIEFGDDNGSAVANFLHKNFLVNRKKIYFITNEFYKNNWDTKKRIIEEHICVLTGVDYGVLQTAIGQKKIIDEQTDENEKQYLRNMENCKYKGKLKLVLDAAKDPCIEKTFPSTPVSPNAYKLCHNIINYVDYITIELGLSKRDRTSIFRFFDVIPPTMLCLSEAPYDFEKMIIGGFLERHPDKVDQSWFGDSITYAQTNIILSNMKARKVKLSDVMGDILLDFPNNKETFVGTEPIPKKAEEKYEANCYIVIGDKFSGKSFIAKRLTEHLDKVYGVENVTIIEDYKAKLPKVIKEDKKHIVIDSSMLNKEYARRSFKICMKEKLSGNITVNYIFINVSILAMFKSMVMKYTRSAYPTEYTTNSSPKGYFQSNFKNSNIIDITNCFWIDASREECDFSFEINRQMH